MKTKDRILNKIGSSRASAQLKFTLAIAFAIIALAFIIEVSYAIGPLTTVTLNAPADGANISGMYTFNATTDGATSWVQFWWWNSDVSQWVFLCNNTTGTTGFTCQYNVSNLSPGVHTFNATAFNGTFLTSDNNTGITVDYLPVVISSVSVSPDMFICAYSNISANNLNNELYLRVNATDSGPSGVAWVKANITQINASAPLVNLTLNVSSGLYEARIQVNNTTTKNFELVNVTITANDYIGNGYTGQNLTPIILYNMTTPPAQGSCEQFGSATTSFCNQTNFSAVNYVVEVLHSNSSACNGGIELPWSGFKAVIKINFTNPINFTDENMGSKMQAVGSAIMPYITMPGQFGDSYIWVNSSAISDISPADITMYGLPFSSVPTISEVTSTGGGASNIIWTPSTPYSFMGMTVPSGNLSFTVSHFSQYNMTDNVAPTITINKPAAISNLSVNVVNVTVNGTGTQLSNITIYVDGAVIFTANNSQIFSVCTNNTQNWDVVTCNNTTSALTDGSHNFTVLARDLGGAAGNTNTTVGTFIVDNSTPLLTITNPATNMTNESSTTVNLNLTIIEANVLANGLNLNLDGASTNYTYVNGSNTIPLSGLSEGLHTVIITVRDIAGRTNSSNRTFRVDVGAPVISDITITPAATSAVITANCTDTGIGVVNATLYYGNTTDLSSAPVTNVTAGNGVKKFSLSTLSTGTVYYFKISATDQLGKTSTNTTTMSFSTTSTNTTEVLNTTTTAFTTNTTVNGTSTATAGFEVSVNTSVNASISVSTSSNNPTGASIGVPALNKYLNITDVNLTAVLNWVIIKIYYTTNELTAAGIDESSLKIYWYNGTAWQAMIGGLSSDANGKYVWANSTHFSIYGLGGILANGQACSVNSNCSSGICCSSVCASSCETATTPSGPSGPGGLPPNTTSAAMRWLSILSGDTATFTINNTKIFANQIKLTVRDTAANVMLKVTGLDKKPVTITTPAGEVFGYMEIVSTGLDSNNIKEASVSFKVSKTWLTTNNIDSSRIVLQRHTTNGWTELTTAKISEDSSYVYFEAKTPGFSVFAVTTTLGTATTPTTGLPSTTPTAPPATGPALTPVITTSATSSMYVVVILLALAAVVIYYFFFRPKK